MSGVAGSFPKPFADLEPVAGWALPSELARNQKRGGASTEELRSFYDLVEPRLRAIIEYLDGFSLDGLKGPEQRLLWLSFAMAEVAFAVEKYDGVGRVPYSIDPERMVPLHDTSSPRS